jgi:hypothetical protein
MSLDSIRDLTPRWRTRYVIGQAGAMVSKIFCVSAVLFGAVAFADNQKPTTDEAARVVKQFLSAVKAKNIPAVAKLLSRPLEIHGSLFASSKINPAVTACDTIKKAETEAELQKLATCLTSERVLTYGEIGKTEAFDKNSAHVAKGVKGTLEKASQSETLVQSRMSGGGYVDYYLVFGLSTKDNAVRIDLIYSHLEAIAE